MEGIAQLVRVSVCGTEGRRFEPGHPPLMGLSNKKIIQLLFFALYRIGSQTY